MTTTLLLLAACLGSTDDIINATCAVNRGSGTTFAQDRSHVWIVTAGHCVLDKNEKLATTYVVFFNSGESSKRMKSEVLWYKYVKTTTEDMAILKVPKTEFGDYPIPDPIPIAESRAVQVGEVIVSCGCPVNNGLDQNWPTAWKGKVTFADNGTFKFRPRPLSGRSGSGIFNKSGTHLIGIVILQDGTTVPLQKIYSMTQWGKK